ncbi:DNA methyltransferase [Xanthobacter flavus]|uniref:DNA methyltransferase n=1 Tax=Xanthobacter flavus TaxID=281 RepID=UPI003726FAA5
MLRAIPDASIHAVVTDPPYALVSIGKRFGKEGAAPAQFGRDGAYSRASAGFMGQQWDTGEVAFAAEFWSEVLRVLKPGGHVAAFSHVRTYHRVACAIEDAGFEIRDQLAWCYATGFPKGIPLGKHVDAELGIDWWDETERERGEVSHAHAYLDAFDIALKPAWEPIALARKPLEGTVAANVLAHGAGALNIDGCRVGDEVRRAAFTSLAPCSGNALGAAGTSEARRGTQGDIKTYVGRWPANIVHDGSPEVVAAFPEAPGALRAVTGNEPSSPFANVYGDMPSRAGGAIPRGDSGSAARFFYSAKADSDDRLGSKHPTVKPVDLMQWLCRLVTPPGGTVLDPFAGTGTTGEAAWREGFSAVLVEREAEYQADIRRRMGLCLAGPAERKRESVKARAANDDPGPLFGAVHQQKRAAE